MKVNKWLICILVFESFVFLGCQGRKSIAELNNGYSGSKSCIECHEKFYNLWAPSHHGKAMQPVTGTFLMEDSIPSSPDFELEGKKYQIEIRDSLLIMLEKDNNSITEYNVVWALGGKNVFYFLTGLGQGKLQTIPLAYDVRSNQWYNNPESAVRHFPAGQPDEALSWKDRAYTFNTSCYSCHVSQLNTNYTLENDSYLTSWNEAGINCETCHGPSAGHVNACREAGEGNIPDDLKIIKTSIFTQEQHNASCAPCHAKMRSITASYMPGSRYFDNYDLTTLEHNDFYPDGRDLGENYTMTTWALNKCALKSELHCVTCHTSSGRTRYVGSESNRLCMPCHEENVNNVASHSRHEEGSPGAKCVNCHMPQTVFGRMVRSDHSFRSPMPEATIKFQSPNACNICHDDETPQWANKHVKERGDENYQQETIYWGQLIKEAREDNWDRVDEILGIIENNTYGEVVTNSLVRLLVSYNNDKKWDALFAAMENPSPLVRSSAASALSGNFSEKARALLIDACRDEYRLPRVSAALTLAGFPGELFTTEEDEIIAKATEEYKISVLSRPDDWSAHYNIGIYYQNRGDVNNALNSYETSTRLYAEAILPLINSSVLYSYTGNQAKAEESLKKAIRIDPDNEAANLNLGLLLAEQGRGEEAKKALEKVLDVNPNQAVAAYNLSVLSSETNIEEAISFAKIAANSMPENTRYGYTLAFFQNQAGKTNEAIFTLKKILKEYPGDLNSAYLLADIYIKKGEAANAVKLYKGLLKNDNITDAEKSEVKRVLSRLLN